MFMSAKVVRVARMGRRLLAGGAISGTPLSVNPLWNWGEAALDFFVTAIGETHSARGIGFLPFLRPRPPRCMTDVDYPDLVFENSVEDFVRITN